jgi:dihydroorotate dehydrogenase electron transfer subunit
MPQFQATIVEKVTLQPALWRLTVEFGPLGAVEPGQFFLVRCTDHLAAYLRRPLFPATVETETCTFLLQPDPDPGLAWLLAQSAGQTLDLLGPLGRGFQLGPTAQNLLLVADSPLVGPLLGLAGRESSRQGSVVMVLGGRRANDLFPLAHLPPAVEVRAATLDGSLGRRGHVTDLLADLLPWADAVGCIGSDGLTRVLRQQIAQVRLEPRAGFAQVLLTQPALHVCGVGSCLACVVPTERGLRPACVDGPVFDLAALILDEGQAV